MNKRKILLLAMLCTVVTLFAEVKILTQQSWQVVYDASDYMEQQNYEMVKQKLYNSNNTYYEGQAVNLAYAYTILGEYEAGLELCRALITYNGESINSAYFLRGFINEQYGKKIAALEDYQRSNQIEYYNSLYNKLFRPYPSPEKQLKLLYEQFSPMQVEQTKIQKSHH